jgi:gamma-resorcylate decarboxylase
MQGKIALEEHFTIAETASKSSRYPTQGYWADLQRQLPDFHGERLTSMDAAGIELAVLSLNSPAIQVAMPVAEAVELARKANDVLAREIAKRPDRFDGVAALPMQDPEAAARELTRAVRDLNFKGALVNGFSEIGPDRLAYYDTPDWLPFWAEVEKLDVPFYLHPRDPLPSQNAPYEGHPWLIGSPWGFAEQTSRHALRLIGSGLFDLHPKLKIVLGHLGERIPYDLWRLDHRLSLVPGLKIKRKMGDYFRDNFHVTTSGNYSTPTMTLAIAELGIDRVMFSVDYPFEANAQAAAWFDATPLSPADRAKIGRDNAIKLFKLKL